MRKHFALMATVAALAVSPALAQTTMEKQDTQRTQAQPSTQAPSGTQAPAASSTRSPSTQAMPSDRSTQAMPGERFVDMQASGQWLASDLMGLNVVGSNNENIGSVSDLLVDEDGNIHAAIVGVGGFLGIGQKNVAISFETFDIARDENGKPEARLTLTKEELESAPEFKKAENPRAASRPAAPAQPANPRN
jgi:sporulation protein YlmC with PRC-barrel domain